MELNLKDIFRWMGYEIGYISLNFIFIKLKNI